MSRAAPAALGIALLAAVATTAHRPDPYPDAPPPATTGGFGEPTCVACHVPPFVPDSEGSLALEGVPARFEPGREYPLSVVLRRPGLERAGFELSVRGEAGRGFGLQAGSIRPVSPRVGLTGQDGVDYAHHTEEGSHTETPGVARWRIDWRAPATREPVVFHVVANAANGDDSPLGDVILAREARVAPIPAP